MRAHDYMTPNELYDLTRGELLTFIRRRLAYDLDVQALFNEGAPHKKIHMSGQGDGCEPYTGFTVVHNMGIVNLFADLGIYDGMRYLMLHAYKGIVSLHYCKKEPDEVSFGGCTTSEIILGIFNVTIFAGRKPK